jgi:hypothetical protein
VADWKVVAAELKAFDGRREVVKALRRAIREPVPAIRAAVSASALSTLPRRGGLGAWVAASKLSASVKVTGRIVGLLIKGGRSKSTGGRADVRAIDRGRVRHPSWGRRWEGQWHTQLVRPGYFTDAAAESADVVERTTTDAVDRAFDQIRG